MGRALAHHRLACTLVTGCAPAVAPLSYEILLIAGPALRVGQLEGLRRNEAPVTSGSWSLVTVLPIVRSLVERPHFPEQRGV